MAPLHLKPLLEIFCMPMAEDCYHLMHGAKSVADDLVAWDLVEWSDLERPEYHGYSCTEKGRVFVEAVLSVPLPVQTWQVVPEDRP